MVSQVRRLNRRRHFFTRLTNRRCFVCSMFASKTERRLMTARAKLSFRWWATCLTLVALFWLAWLYDIGRYSYTSDEAAMALIADSRDAGLPKLNIGEPHGLVYLVFSPPARGDDRAGRGPPLKGRGRKSIQALAEPTDATPNCSCISSIRLERSSARVTACRSTGQGPYRVGRSAKSCWMCTSSTSPPTLICAGLHGA